MTLIIGIVRVVVELFLILLSAPARRTWRRFVRHVRWNVAVRWQAPPSWRRTSTQRPSSPA